jgi:pyruvate dehydrogenase E2 component (dihydrolipoamide acetyltransferase)
MAFIMKAVVLALKRHPNFNASFDQENERMIFKKYINLGMAVDTPDGLIVPNIKSPDQKSILELAREIRSLADDTVARKVQLNKLQNTTFTITNFGAADVAYGTPIINHPEVAILGIGRISQKPVVMNGEIKAAYVLPLSLAVDHRVIDGADAGRFLSTIKSLLNDPMMLLLS